ncbi:MAG TPA: hypothetical protein P5205_14220 [Candidatus Paceibacterota bacterium]|nr:hypothetical protein [Verrucomicrobiota bacterium]HSA11518.1 hypothetical protein [Candidatus Paceibacterota bacterium]
MNIRKLPKDKRNKLLLALLLALAAAAGLYFGLIRGQYASLANLARQKEAAANKLKVVLDSIRRAETIQIELNEAKAKLAAEESDVASGDLYAWVINTLRNFNTPVYKVEIPQYSHLSPPADVKMLPDFPYKEATLTVAGTARFHNLGQFIADFENKFPHIRLSDLSLDANVLSPTVGAESLAFKMEIVTLVKLNPS